MAYIGRDTDKISNVEVLDNITFDGSSSYTLQKGGSNFTPSSANTILLSIDGVVQAGNFTVSGSTIDFGTAVAGTSTCDFILHYGVGLITTPSDGTVTAAKLNDDIISGQTALASEPADTDEFLVSDAGTLKRIDYSLIKGGGITMADQFRLTADFTSNGDLTANLERVDDASYGSIGTGMTESSGVFTFPSTGIYLVQLQASMLSGANDNVKIYTYVSTDGGSNYDLVMEVYAGSSDQENTGYGSALIDVTNTSNVKVKFTSTSLGSGAAVLGSTDHNSTSFLFMRLGDT